MVSNESATDLGQGQPLTLRNVVTLMPTNKDIGPAVIQTEVYKRRWLVLGLFVLFSAVNNMQWIQYTIIGNIISRYYDVSQLAVDWTSLVFNVCYIALLFPACYVMDCIGLRWTCLVGCIGTCVGAWIKVFSVAPNLFVVTFIGQALVAVSQTFVMAVPARLAANWFGPRQVASATAIGCFGCQLGIATFFLLTPMVVKNHESIEDIGKDLAAFFWGVAIFCTLVTVALFIFFSDEPPLPPSETRALQKINREAGGEGFWPPFRRILTNKSFLILWNCYGINVGALNTISTLLNPMYIIHFKNGEEDAGRIGLLFIVMGTFGSIVFGVILDKTKKFKELTVFLYTFSLVGEALFAVALWMEQKWMVFGGSIVLGIFMVGYVTVGIEVCAEITYPEPEGISTGVLNMANQVYGMVLVLIVSKVMDIYGDMAGHLCLCMNLTLGIFLTATTKNEQRRQNARKNLNYIVVLQQVE